MRRAESHRRPGIVRLKLAGRMVRVPGFLWRRMVAAEGRRMARAIAFMTPDHHAVRNFVVREIAGTGKPIDPQQIRDALQLPLTRVSEILDELERRMVFLWRGEGGKVRWAYPVTCDETPVRIEFIDAKPTWGA